MAEVQQEHEEKAKAKVDCDTAKKKGIICAAEFKKAYMANEDITDATPRPPFTPKPWPPCHNKKGSTANVVPMMNPIAELRVDTDNNDPAPAAPELVTEDEPESNDTTLGPPTKKQKTLVKEKATQTVGTNEKVAVWGGNKASKNLAADEEGMPKPKKVKPKLHNEINLAAKEMENEVKGNKYGDMVKSMSSG